MADARIRQPPKLILASGSPRRRRLLSDAGVSFRVVESRLPEDPPTGESGGDYAPRIAREKALKVSATFPNEIVLAADTVVECQRRILGKPADSAQARAMLQTLSGRTHTVITAFAIARAGAILESASVSSRVTFRDLSSAEIEAYIRSGEPGDKAGGYGIQGKGGDFITHVEGSRDNVMGLPTREVLAALKRQGVGSGGAEK